MITYISGNLFHSPAQVLVNTVNTVGVMGKGIALEFKRTYPEMFKQYQWLCERGQLQIGDLWLWKSQNKWVLNFPTKKHWRSPSRPEYVEAGLKKFCKIYADFGIHSIAFPALGCGNGELDFETEVRPLMERYLKELPIDIFIYPDREDPHLPEHIKPKEFRQWLRSRPRALAFAEVWYDIQELLSNKRRFRTLHGKNEFIAELMPNSIKIVSPRTNRTFYVIQKETLLNFWQQLREYGFSTRKISPGVNKELSYLIPIFAKLPYVRVVTLTEMHGSRVDGLQFVPGLANLQTAVQQQLPLFDI